MKAAEMGYQQRDFYDVDAAVDRLGEQIDRQRAVDVVCADIAKHADILRQRAADEAEAVRLMSTSRRLEGFKLFVDVLSRRYRFTVSATRQRWDLAEANHDTRTIYIRPIESDADFAVALHETGHLIAGRCSSRSPHRRTPNGCMQCENDAWRQALNVSPVLTREMHDRLSHCLRTYRWEPAPAATVRDLDRLASSSGYCEARQAKVARELQQQRQHYAETSLRAQRQRYGSR